MKSQSQSKIKNQLSQINKPGQSIDPITDVPSSEDNSLLVRPPYQTKDIPYPTVFSNYRGRWEKMTQDEQVESFVILQSQIERAKYKLNPSANDMMIVSQSQESTQTTNTLSNPMSTDFKRKKQPFKYQNQIYYANEAIRQYQDNAQGSPMNILPPDQSNSSIDEQFDQNINNLDKQAMRPSVLSAYLNPNKSQQQIIRYLCSICKKERELQVLNQYQLQIQFQNREQICQFCKASMDSARLQQAPSSISSLILSPSTKKLQMRQIEKKECQDDSESFLLPSISFTTFSEISNHSTFNFNEIQQNLRKIEQQNSMIRNSSKGIFKIDTKAPAQMNPHLNQVDNSAIFSHLNNIPSMLDQSDDQSAVNNIDDYSSNECDSPQIVKQLSNEDDFRHIEIDDQDQLDQDNEEQEEQIESQSQKSKEEFNCTDTENSQISACSDKEQVMINLENVLFIEDRIFLMNEKLKSANYLEESQKIIELCEDWWELLRQESSLFEIYVNNLSNNSYTENIQG
ncbi:UNKNOWN [Stylonychia lemnae]|uniref:Uncharacterized protein n=1 Tax=Stylonychia lemnae TaxID=5949 RepID=A0A078B2B0_STYLE|nr:UNKNOWN [Stylonychia lemnae]|eukprot:CDW88680.1 UNKNOWN [Stylonychia lemnae]